jgi:hypothetical protein
MSKLILVTSSLLLLLGAAYSLKAAPVHSAKEFRVLADRPAHFPSTTIFNGRSYERLTGVALKGAIIGKSVDPVSRCRGCTDSGQSFNPDGTYLADGDRWTEGGRYVVARDMVLVRLARGSLRYAFYRARDGGMLLAFESSDGGIQFVEVKAS